MVTGGYYYDDGDNNLDSTELLRPGSDWQVIPSAWLPRPLYGLRLNTVDNRVLLSGELLIMIILLHLPHTDPCYRGMG